MKFALDFMPGLVIGVKMRNVWLKPAFIATVEIMAIVNLSDRLVVVEILWIIF